MKYRLPLFYGFLILLVVILTWGENLGLILIGEQAGGTIAADLVLLLLGMVLITHGGDLFTDSAVAIARATRIPPVIVGATVVSMATTFPEFMVSVTGALNGSPGFAVGNALGSCCCNIGLIVGTCAILQGWLAKKRNEEPGIPVSRVTLFGSGSFMLASGIAVLLFAIFFAGANPLPNVILRWEAVVLVLILVAYLGYSVRLAFQARHESAIDSEEAEADDEIREHIGGQITKFAAGAALVFLGSRLLVVNAQVIAEAMGVPELWIGLTVLAIGTSLPEYTISLMAVLKGHGALGLGNIIGANVLNICWVVATCALIKPLAIQEQTILLDAPVVLLLMSILVFGPLKAERVTVCLGAVMVGIYLSYYAAIVLFFG